MNAHAPLVPPLTLSSLQAGERGAAATALTLLDSPKQGFGGGGSGGDAATAASATATHPKHRQQRGTGVVSRPWQVDTAVAATPLARPPRAYRQATPKRLPVAALRKLAPAAASDLSDRDDGDGDSGGGSDGGGGGDRGGGDHGDVGDDTTAPTRVAHVSAVSTHHSRRPQALTRGLVALGSSSAMAELRMAIQRVAANPRSTPQLPSKADASSPRAAAELPASRRPASASMVSPNGEASVACSAAALASTVAVSEATTATTAAGDTASGTVRAACVDGDQPTAPASRPSATTGVATTTNARALNSPERAVSARRASVGAHSVESFVCPSSGTPLVSGDDWDADGTGGGTAKAGAPSGKPRRSRHTPTGTRDARRHSRVASIDARAYGVRVGKAGPPAADASQGSRAELFPRHAATHRVPTLALHRLGRDRGTQSGATAAAAKAATGADKAPTTGKARRRRAARPATADPRRRRAAGKRSGKHSGSGVGSGGAARDGRQAGSHTPRTHHSDGDHGHDGVSTALSLFEVPPPRGHSTTHGRGMPGDPSHASAQGGTHMSRKSRSRRPGGRTRVRPRSAQGLGTTRNQAGIDGRPPTHARAEAARPAVSKWRPPRHRPRPSSAGHTSGASTGREAGGSTAVPAPKLRAAKPRPHSALPQGRQPASSQPPVDGVATTTAARAVQRPASAHVRRRQREPPLQWCRDTTSSTGAPVSLRDVRRSSSAAELAYHARTLVRPAGITARVAGLDGSRSRSPDTARRVSAASPRAQQDRGSGSRHQEPTGHPQPGHGGSRPTAGTSPSTNTATMLGSSPTPLAPPPDHQPRVPVRAMPRVGLRLKASRGARRARVDAMLASPHLHHLADAGRKYLRRKARR